MEAVADGDSNPDPEIEWPKIDPSLSADLRIQPRVELAWNTIRAVQIAGVNPGWCVHMHLV